jgi:hypothetical protein
MRMLSGNQFTHSRAVAYRVKGGDVKQSSLVWMSLAWTVTLVPALSVIAQEEIIRDIRNYSLASVKITAIPTAKVGTGFIVSYERPAKAQVLVSNEHMFRSADSLRLSIQLGDSSRWVIDTSCVTVRLYSPSGDSLFAVASDGADVAAALLPTIPSKGQGLNVQTVQVTGLCSIDRVFQGESVLYFGFPLGISVNGIGALLRTGTVSGVDMRKGHIFLEAQAFGGSSGSPVFIDPREVLRKSAVCVGMISEYIPFEKRFKNLETDRVEMVQNENSGLAVVVPVGKIDPVCLAAIARFASSQPK